MDERDEKIRLLKQQLIESLGYSPDEADEWIMPCCGNIDESFDPYSPELERDRALIRGCCTLIDLVTTDVLRALAALLPDSGLAGSHVEFDVPLRVIVQKVLLAEQADDADSISDDAVADLMARLGYSSDAVGSFWGDVSDSMSSMASSDVVSRLHWRAQQSQGDADGESY